MINFTVCNVSCERLCRVINSFYLNRNSESSTKTTNLYIKILLQNFVQWYGNKISNCSRNN